MKGLVVFLLILIIIASLSFVAANISNISNEKINDKNENKILEFSTFTSAVCEDKENFVHCKDEMFVNCNGKISKAVDVAECNGIKLDVPKALGFAVFEKDWKDPRLNN